jgi:hypothetical protein
MIVRSAATFAELASQMFAGVIVIVVTMMSVLTTCVVSVERE